MKTPLTINVVMFVLLSSTSLLGMPYHGNCNLPEELDVSHLFATGKIMGYDSIEVQDEFGPYMRPIVIIQTHDVYFGQQNLQKIRVHIGPAPSFCTVRFDPQRYSKVEIQTQYPLGSTITFIGTKLGLSANDMLIEKCFHLLTYRGSINGLKHHTTEEFIRIKKEGLDIHRKIEESKRNGSVDTSRLYYDVQKDYLERMKMYRLERLPERLQYYLTIIAVKKSKRKKRKERLLSTLLWYQGPERNLEKYITTSNISASAKARLLEQYQEIHTMLGKLD